MVAMPYILVTIVLDLLSIPFFSLTSTGLLLNFRLAKKLLPERLWTPAWVPFAVIALLMTSLATGVRLLAGRVVFGIFGWAGFINSLVLVYRFLDKRWFLGRPQVLRRLLIALLSAVVTTAAVIAIQAVVVVLFVIR